MLPQKNKKKKISRQKAASINNPFINFLIEEFSFFSSPAVKAKKAQTGKIEKTIIGKHPDHMLLDMLIKEKHRKVLSKMGKIEKALDYHLHKANKNNSKEIQDIEERLVAEWQKEFVALREDILKGVPDDQRKNYRKMLSDHIKDSVNHPHHLYPFLIPVNEKRAVEAKVGHRALKTLTAALAALILAVSIALTSPGFSNKIIDFTDKALFYPIAKIDQLFFDGNLSTNKIAAGKNKAEINKEVLAAYIVENREKLKNRTGEINLTENDIYGVVAGVEESTPNEKNTDEPKTTKKCVLVRLKKIADKMGETQKRISLNLEEKLNDFLR